jgi:hypothetical protein
MTRTYLVARFDVTALSEAERAELEGAVVVQGERKKASFPDEVGYPDVNVESSVLEFRPVEECSHGISLADECEDCEMMLQEAGRDGVGLRYVWGPGAEPEE